VVLQGNEVVQLADGNDTAEGIWEYVGDNSGKTYRLADFGAVDYFNLVIADTHTHRDTFQTTSDLTVRGALTLSGGTLAASGGSVTTAGLALSGTGILNAPALLTDSGNWTHNGGSFNANSGTVILNGTNQHINGSTIFHNLSKVTSAADTLTFQANTTQTITGSLTLEGSSGRLLSLRSSTPASAWNIDPLDTALLSFLNVRDSLNLGKPVSSTRSVNSGHNKGWTFPLS
jgi:hypothetical protein